MLTFQMWNISSNIFLAWKKNYAILQYKLLFKSLQGLGASFSAHLIKI